MAGRGQLFIEKLADRQKKVMDCSRDTRVPPKWHMAVDAIIIRLGPISYVKAKPTYYESPFSAETISVRLIDNLCRVSGSKDVQVTSSQLRSSIPLEISLHLTPPVINKSSRSISITIGAGPQDAVHFPFPDMPHRQHRLRQSHLTTPHRPWKTSIPIANRRCSSPTRRR